MKTSFIILFSFCGFPVFRKAVMSSLHQRWPDSAMHVNAAFHIAFCGQFHFSGPVASEG